jgi:hypothetical protein
VIKTRLFLIPVLILFNFKKLPHDFGTAGYEQQKYFNLITILCRTLGKTRFLELELELFIWASQCKSCN